MNLYIKQNIKLRNKNYIRIVNKEIKTYIKNGCKGSLNLYKKPIHVLPNNLKVINGDFFIEYHKLKLLPNDLSVNGHLILINAPTKVTFNNDILKYKFNVTGNIYYALYDIYN